MKTLFLFTDVETTGLYQVEDQILTYATIFTEKSQSIFEKEIKIKLKNNILPNPQALITNNINPYDPDYLKESLSEYDACHFFINKILDLKKDGHRLILVAYNAQFDFGMLGSMCKRNGINLNSLVDSIFDPLIMAKSMVQNGTLKTKEIETGYGGKKYRSAKLEDVYNALGYSSSLITAHNALEDTKMLKTIVDKLYYLFTGKSFEDISVNMEDFLENDVKTIVYEENSEFKIKTVKILKKCNEIGKTGMFVLDYDGLIQENYQIKNAVVFLNQIKIIDDLDVRSVELNKLENFYLENKSSVDDFVKKQSFPSLEVFNSFEIIFFKKIESILEKKINDPKYVLNDEEALLEKDAEELSFSKYNKGWNKKDLNVFKKMNINENYSVELSYAGYYELKNNGKSVYNSEKKTDFLEKLVVEQLITTGTELYKKVNAFLVPVKSFKTLKHHSFLIKEFNEKKTAIFNGSNKLHKETLKSLLEHYKKINNEAFKDVTIPEFKLNLNLFKKQT